MWAYFSISGRGWCALGCVHMCAHTSSVIRTHLPRPEIKKYALITFYRSVQMWTHTSSASFIQHISYAFCNTTALKLKLIHGFLMCRTRYWRCMSVLHLFVVLFYCCKLINIHWSYTRLKRNRKRARTQNKDIWWLPGFTIFLISSPQPYTTAVPIEKNVSLSIWHISLI